MIIKWDLPTRLYHWIQALLTTLLLISGYNGDGSVIIHQASGLLVLLLLVWRVIWGFAGSQTARFADFLTRPRQIIRYFLGKSVKFTGHNPAGGLMAVLMISLLLLQATSGLLTSEFSDSVSLLGRDITGWLEEFHNVTAVALTGLVALHLTAIIIYKHKGQPLIRAMLNGYADSTGPQPFLKSNRRAAFVLLISAVLLVSLIAALILLTY